MVSSRFSPRSRKAKCPEGRRFYNARVRGIFFFHVCGFNHVVRVRSCSHFVFKSHVPTPRRLGRPRAARSLARADAASPWAASRRALARALLGATSVLARVAFTVALDGDSGSRTEVRRGMSSYAAE